MKLDFCAEFNFTKIYILDGETATSRFLDLTEFYSDTYYWLIIDKGKEVVVFDLNRMLQEKYTHFIPIIGPQMLQMCIAMYNLETIREKNDIGFGIIEKLIRIIQNKLNEIYNSD